MNKIAGQRFFPKELSWLSFNERVLQEAADKNNPIIERFRFLGIYSSNMDEFYRVTPLCQSSCRLLQFLDRAAVRPHDTSFSRAKRSNS
jgi:polyphosphate kinase